jgi:5-methylthioadenosine/S-adenosylhomocysteine deaminase
MHDSGLLLHGKHLISNDRELGNIPDGAVACEGGVIAAVGPYEELKRRYPDAVPIGSPGHVVMPGLVNAHGHGWGLSPIQMGYLDTPIELWGERKPEADDYHDAAFAAIRLMRSGVTTSVVHRSPRHQARLRAHADAGLRVTFAAAVSETRERRERAESTVAVPSWHSEYFERVDRLIQQYQDNPRVQIQYGPVSPHYCSTRLLEAIRHRANDHGIPIHTHLLETVYQREVTRRKYGRSAVEHLRDIGFLGADTTLAHLVWPSQSDIEILAECGARAVHSPSSNLATWAGIMPLMSLRAAGITVGLGMDDAGLNDDDDMFTEMRMCLRLHRQPALTEHCLTCHDVLQMATVGSAKSLSLEHRIGSLVPGKAADVILVDFDAATYPYIDPGVDIVDAVVHRCRATHVRTTVVDGYVIMRDGQITTLDEDDIVERLQASAREVQRSPFREADGSWPEMTPGVRDHYSGLWDKGSATPFTIYNDRM